LIKDLPDYFSSESTREVNLHASSKEEIRRKEAGAATLKVG